MRITRPPLCQKMTAPQRRTAKFAVAHGSVVRELGDGHMPMVTWRRMLGRMCHAGWMQPAAIGDGYLITERGRAAIHAH